MTTHCLILLLGLLFPGEWQTLDGQVFSGDLIEVTTEGNLVMETDSELKQFAPEDLLTIYFPLLKNADPRTRGGGLLLADGSFLKGAIQGGDEESLYFSHSLLGTFPVSIDHLAVIAFNDADLPGDFPRYQQMAVDDALYKKSESGKGRDFIKGTLDRFDATGLTFDCNLGLLTFPYEELEALTLPPFPAEKRVRSVSVIAVLGNGSGLIRGRLMKGNRQEIYLSSSFHDALKIPISALDSLVFEAVGRDSLADLKPSACEEIPYIGEDSHFLYPFQVDRSVTHQLLSCAGRVYGRGLGLHARTVLTYPLAGRYRAFEAYLGICDEVRDLPAKGSVQFRVLVDGTERYTSAILRGGDPPCKMKRIDLAEATSLTVEVNFADGFDSGDRALIGNPVLIKP